MTTAILLPSTPSNPNNPIVTGNAVSASGYYLSNNTLQTISYSLNSFTGNIVLEATLSDPSNATDWFQIGETITGATLTSSAYVNIIGDFIYIRATVNSFTNGTINYIKVSY